MLREDYDLFHENTGETWLILTTTVEDPIYLDAPLILTAQFRKEADGSRWDPTFIDTLIVLTFIVMLASLLSSIGKWALPRLRTWRLYQFPAPPPVPIGDEQHMTLHVTIGHAVTLHSLDLGFYASRSGVRADTEAVNLKSIMWTTLDGDRAFPGHFTQGRVLIGTFTFEAKKTGTYWLGIRGSDLNGEEVGMCYRRFVVQ